MKEQVNHPDHYKGQEIECIDAMESAFGTDKLISWCHITAFKYLWRCGKKDSEIQEIDKSIWYLNKEKELINKKHDAENEEMHSMWGDKTY